MSYVHYCQPIQALIHVATQDYKALERIPFGTLRSVEAKMSMNEIVFYEGEIIAHPNDLVSIANYCHVHNIQILSTNMNGPIMYADDKPGLEQIIKDYEINKYNYEYKKNLYDYESGKISGQSLLEPFGIDLQAEINAVAAEQKAAALQQIESVMEVPRPKKSMSQNIDEGRGFDMDFEDL